MGICGSNAPAGESKDSVDAKANAETYIQNKYKQGKVLGKGGSCKVMEATRKSDGKKFALKIMSHRERMNEDLWKKEKDILGELKHPNIICMAEAHRDKANFYIVSELCEGGELFDRIVDKTNPITEKRAAELVRTMLLAIEHCHSRNIVHRDLKPENFVFKSPAQDSEMVLIDFGCAKVVDDKTEYKDLVGTPYYLAPESAAGHKYIRTGLVLKASDVWSIGVIAFVLMTGRPPFNGHSNTEIFSSIIKKPLKFPAQVKLSKSFISFVQMMLKKSPKRRMHLSAALKHEWVTGKKADDKPLSPDVMRVLRQFNKQSKLKKAITKTLAAHMGKQPQEKIKAHFRKLDVNNDGKLDKSEMTQLLISMGVEANKAKVDAGKILETSDMDGNGYIEFHEFAQIWQRKLLSVNESYIHAVFQVLDEDNDGSISKDELRKVLEIEDEEALDEIIAEVDTNNDGVLSLEEFVNAMKEQGVQGAGPGVLLDDKDVKNAAKDISAGDIDNYVDEIDENDDGKISSREMANAYVDNEMKSQN